jgi:hypothetical protein
VTELSTYYVKNKFRNKDSTHRISIIFHHTWPLNSYKNARYEIKGCVVKPKHLIDPGTMFLLELILMRYSTGEHQVATRTIVIQYTSGSRTGGSGTLTTKFHCQMSNFSGTSWITRKISLCTRISDIQNRPTYSTFIQSLLLFPTPTVQQCIVAPVTSATAQLEPNLTSIEIMFFPSNEITHFQMQLLKPCLPKYLSKGCSYNAKILATTILVLVLEEVHSVCHSNVSQLTD